MPLLGHPSQAHVIAFLQQGYKEFLPEAKPKAVIIFTAHWVSGRLEPDRHLYGYQGKDCMS